VGTSSSQWEAAGVALVAGVLARTGSRQCTMQGMGLAASLAKPPVQLLRRRRQPRRRKQQRLRRLRQQLRGSCLAVPSCSSCCTTCSSITRRLSELRVLVCQLRQWQQLRRRLQEVACLVEASRCSCSSGLHSLASASSSQQLLLLVLALLQT
jgi:hypothetical protein